MKKEYAALEDMYYVMEKVTKATDRISMLEDRVRELDASCELLSESEKLAVVEHKEKNTASPNQKRYYIIHKAKQFINEKSTSFKVFEFGVIHYKIEFKVKKAKRTVEALLIGQYTGHVHKRVKVTCHPDDVFNEYLGKAVAIGRLFGLDVTEFEDAPQPDTIIKGHQAVINHCDYRDIFTFDEVYSDNVYDMTHEDGRRFKKYQMTDSAENFYKILNDTDVNYSLLHK